MTKINVANTAAKFDMEIDEYTGCMRVGPIQGTAEYFWKVLRNNELSVGYLHDEVEMRMSDDGYIEIECDSANGALFDEFGLEAHREVVEDFLMDYLDEDEVITFSGYSMSAEEQLLHKITTYRKSGGAIHTSTSEKNSSDSETVPIWTERDLISHAYVEEFPFAHIAANDNIIPFPIARRS